MMKAAEGFTRKGIHNWTWFSGRTASSGDFSRTQQWTGRASRHSTIYAVILIGGRMWRNWAAKINC